MFNIIEYNLYRVLINLAITFSSSNSTDSFQNFPCLNLESVLPSKSDHAKEHPFFLFGGVGLNPH
jgi:hypothetical protein